MCGVKKLVDCALEGFSCTIFAFGQTGSGKTHTITGPDATDATDREDSDGIIQRSISYLHKQSREKDVKITATYIEIYNEQVHDLLDPNPRRRNLPVRQQAGRGFHVDNLFIIDCYTEDDMRAVLEEGLRNRALASHDLNERSSRSHTILTLYIEGQTNIDAGDEKGPSAGLSFTRRGQISFVDLAGSERAKATKAEGQTLVESQSINKSLLTLGNCISALSDPKRRNGHIPFRESTLTMLLKDSLGGASMTLMVACVGPSSLSAQESSSTLRFASRAKNIQNKPVVQIDPAAEHVIALKREVEALREECAFLRRASRAASRADERTDPAAMSELAHELVELKTMLQEAMVQSADLRHENVLLTARREELSRSSEENLRDNAQLLRIIDELESRSKKGSKKTGGTGYGKSGIAGPANAGAGSVWDKYPRAKTSIVGRMNLPTVGGSADAARQSAAMMLSPLNKGTLLSFDKGNETLSSEMMSGEFGRAVLDAPAAASPKESRKKQATSSPKSGPSNLRKLETKVATKSPHAGRKAVVKVSSGYGNGKATKPVPPVGKRPADVTASPRLGRANAGASAKWSPSRYGSPGGDGGDTASISPPRGNAGGSRANTYPSIEQGKGGWNGIMGGRSHTSLSTSAAVNNAALRDEVSAIDREIAAMEAAMTKSPKGKPKKTGIRGR
jgi:hypothetical protein